MLKTQFERIKVGWAPYKLKQHDYGLEVPTDNRADQTPPAPIVLCVYIVYRPKRSNYFYWRKTLFSKQGMRESILKVLGNPPVERKYNYIAREREIFVISKYLILSYRPYQFYFYLQLKLVCHKESIFCKNYSKFENISGSWKIKKFVIIYRNMLLFLSLNSIIIILSWM